MPNQLSLLPSSLYNLSHDPTVTLNGDPMSDVGVNPFGTMTDEILFGAVNELLGWIDDATGLDLLAIVSPLEALLGTSTGLLSGFLGFLTPGSSTLGGGVFGPLLGLIPGLSGGTGTLGGLGSFLNPATLLSGGGIFAPLLSVIPGLGSGTGTLAGLGSFLNPTTGATGLNVFSPLLGGLGLPTLNGLLGFLKPTSLSSYAGVLAPIMSGGLLLTSLIPGLPGLLSGLGLTDLSGLSGLLTAFPMANISGLESRLLGFLTPSSGLNALNIFGTLSPGSIPQIGTGQIGTTVSNLVTNASFNGAGSVNGVGVCTWDGTVDHTGTTGSGSVMFVANGTTKELLSNAIPVSGNQKFTNMYCWVKWQSLVSTGNPIRLAITAYSDEHGSTAVSQTDVVVQAGSPTTSDWRKLTGSYTVPATGVASVRVRLSVNASATAGTVWFDDIFAGKTGPIPTNLVADLTSGNLLSDILTGHDNSFTSLFSTVGTLLPTTTFNNLLTSLSGGSGGFTAIENRLLGFLTPSSTVNAGQIGGTGSIPTNFIPDLGTTRDNIVNAFLNLTGITGWGNNDVASALQQHTQAVAGLAAQVATLNNTFTSGVSFGDDFEYPAGAMNSNWTVTYPSGSAGTIHTDGHYLAYQPSGVSDRVWYAHYNTPTSTDYQFAQAVFGSAPQTPGILPPGSPASNRVGVRMNAANTDMVYAEFGNGTCSLVRVVSGNETVLNSVSWPTPASGSTMGLYAGKPGTARYFKPTLNGQTVFELTEVGTASAVDSNHRFCGVGGKAGSWPLALTQSSPGKLNQFTGADQ